MESPDLIFIDHTARYGLDNKTFVKVRDGERRSFLTAEEDRLPIGIEFWCHFISPDYLVLARASAAADAPWVICRKNEFPQSVVWSPFTGEGFPLNIPFDWRLGSWQEPAVPELLTTLNIVAVDLNRYLADCTHLGIFYVNWATHYLVNCNSVTRQRYVNWLANVDPQTGLSVAEQIANKCNSDVENSRVETAGHMFYGLFHYEPLNSPVVAPILHLLQNAAVICAPIFIGRLSENDLNHVQSVFWALYHMGQINPDSIHSVLSQANDKVDVLMNFLVLLARRELYDDADRQSLQAPIRGIADLIRASDRSTNILRNWLRQNSLQDVFANTELQVFDFLSPTIADEIVFFELEGQWWSDLHITKAEELELEAIAPRHFHVVCNLCDRIMRVPVYLPVRPNLQSMYEAQAILEWIAGGGQLDPATNIPVVFNARSQRGWLQIAHDRKREIRNWTEDNLRAMRNPTVPDLVRKYGGKIVNNLAIWSESKLVISAIVGVMAIILYNTSMKVLVTIT